jgi:excisionase family DNA binding protein
VTLRLAQLPVEFDEGITVAEAARMLGADATTVRDLVRVGELDGWKVGKRRGGKAPTAIRVSRRSCTDYRERHRVGPQPSCVPEHPPKHRRSRLSVAHLEALASLRARGVRV